MTRCMPPGPRVSRPLPVTVDDLVEFWHTEDHGKALDDAARDWLHQHSLVDESVSVDGVKYDVEKIRELVLERHQFATEVTKLRRLLVLRTQALSRVIADRDSRDREPKRIGW